MPPKVAGVLIPSRLTTSVSAFSQHQDLGLEVPKGFNKPPLAPKIQNGEVLMLYSWDFIPCAVPVPLSLNT